MKTTNASKLIAGALALVMVLMMLPFGTMKVSAVTTSHTLDIAGFSSLGAKGTKIPVGTKDSTGYFEVYGKEGQVLVQDGTNLKFQNKGTGGIQFTVADGCTATVTIQYAANGSSPTTLVFQKSDGTEIGTGSSPDKNTQIEYVGTVAAGTYQVTFKSGTAQLRGLTVVEDTEGTVPSSEPVVTDPTESEPTVPAGPATTQIHNFTTDGFTSTFYTISGGSKQNVSTTYNGETLTGALKIDSSASISFDASANGTLTLVYGTTQASTIKVNGTGVDLPTPNADGVFTTTVTAGHYEITRGNKECWIFYIAYVPEGGDTPQPAVDTMAGGSLTLEGNIGVNFYMNLTAETLADTGAKMVFTVNGVTKEVPVSEGVETADGYRFTYPVAAKEMNDTITAKVVRTDGTTSQEFTYSVREYCEGQLNNPDADAKLKAVVGAMLNYGAAAQTHFGYNTANLANAGLETLTGNVPEITAADLESYKGTVNYDNENAGITVRGGTLALESETVVRAYFELADGANIADYTFTVKCGDVEVPVEVYSIQDTKVHVLNIKNIAAQDLENMYTITVTKDGASVLTMTYGAFSYAYTVLNRTDTTPELKQLVSALHAYNVAANAYFATAA